MVPRPRRFWKSGCDDMPACSILCTICSNRQRAVGQQQVPGAHGRCVDLGEDGRPGCRRVIERRVLTSPPLNP